jgi:hypothetical protein
MRGEERGMEEIKIEEVKWKGEKVSLLWYGNSGKSSRMTGSMKRN